MEENGINNRDRAKQLHLFKGILRRGNARPTDIDFFMDYNGKVFLFGEGKHKSAKDINIGQERAFDAICNSYYEEKTEPKWKSKHLVWAFVYEHGTEADEDVIVIDQQVVQVTSNVVREWLEPDSPYVLPHFKLEDGVLTVGSFIHQVEQFCAKNGVEIYVAVENDAE